MGHITLVGLHSQHRLSSREWRCHSASLPSLHLSNPALLYLSVRKSCVCRGLLPTPPSHSTPFFTSPLQHLSLLSNLGTVWLSLMTLYQEPLSIWILHCLICKLEIPVVLVFYIWKLNAVRGEWLVQLIKAICLFFFFFFLEGGLGRDSVEPLVMVSGLLASPDWTGVSHHGLAWWIFLWCVQLLCVSPWWLHLKEPFLTPLLAALLSTIPFWHQVLWSSQLRCHILQSP